MNWSRLFKKARKSELEYALVQVVTSDTVEHYRWCKLDSLSIEKLNATMVWKDDVLEFNKFMQIDRCDPQAPETQLKLKRNEVEVEAMNGCDLYCAVGFNYQPHFIWTSVPLDVICAGFKNVFRSDKGELHNVMTIRLVNIEAPFCYNGNLYRLTRTPKGMPKVVPLNEL